MQKVHAKSTCRKVTIWKDARTWFATLLKLHSTTFVCGNELVSFCMMRELAQDGLIVDQL